MNFWPSGFITIIQYTGPTSPVVEDIYLRTEDNNYLLTEDDLQIEIED